jgi:hypothetical protein
MAKFDPKNQACNALDLPLAEKSALVDKILKTRNIYYSACFFPYRAIYKMLEKVIKIFIWGNQVGAKGILLVALNIFTLPRDQGGFGILDIRAQGVTLFGKWEVQPITPHIV